MLVDDTSSTLSEREPALLRGFIVSVVSTALAIFTGQVTSLDGGTAIAVAVATLVVPNIQALWTRYVVTPAAKSPQTDSL